MKLFGAKKELEKRIKKATDELQILKSRMILNEPNLFINPSGKSFLSQPLEEFDKKTILNRFKWTNLPTLNSMRFEERLYEKGFLAMVKFKDKFYIQPFVMVSSINIDGEVDQIQLTPYATTFDKSRKEMVLIDDKIIISNKNSNGSELFSRIFTVGKDAILIYTNTTSNTGVCITERELTQPFRNLMLKAFSNIDINLIISNIRYLFESDDIGADKNLKAMLEAVTNEQPVVALQKGIGQDLNLIEGQDVKTMELMYSIGEIHAFKMFTLGIMSKHFGQNIGGRVTIGDMIGTEQQVGLVNQANLFYRKIFAEQANKLFNLNISVEDNNFSKNIDMNGQNQVEKEEQKKQGNNRGLN